MGSGWNCRSHRHLRPDCDIQRLELRARWRIVAGMDTTAATTVATALQAIFEALNALAEEVPAHRREAYRLDVRRIAQARTALLEWADEQH